MPEVWIDPKAGGRVTAEALLRPTGTVEVNLGSSRFPKERRCIFHIADGDFWFNLGFLDGGIIFQRCETTLRMSQSFFRKLPQNSTFIASWTLESLALRLGPMSFEGPNISRSVAITPRVAPASLMKWARQQSLVPVVSYPTVADFVARVHSGLSLVQDKIDAMPNRDIFWDFEYSGQRILKRRPKKETDLHGVIHALLSDQLFLSSIEVLPEVQTGVGNLDFMFVGSVDGSGPSIVCAEFKLAHSADLYHGVERQLPAYMKNQRTENGTYCILDFRGRWFDEPKIDDVAMHVKLASRAVRGWPSRHHPIKLHHYRLGTEARASRRG